jgi:hypothetical protein
LNGRRVTATYRRRNLSVMGPVHAGFMATTRWISSRAIHEFYVDRINGLVENDQESAIPALVDEYELLCRQSIDEGRAIRR